MCFVLYIGTTKRIPRRPFRKESPDLSVRALGDRDAPIAKHFGRPEVQYVGSTSGCGCDFPHVTLHKDGWVDAEFAFQLADKERLATVDSNRLRLVELLREIREPVVEAYGVWDGDFEDSPKARETVSLDEILNSAFYFKERAFYRIEIDHVRDP